MRFRLFLLLFGAGLLVVGGAKSWVFFRNLQPAKLTLLEYLQNPPSATWVTLRECELDFENAIALSSRVLKVDKGVVIPLRPKGANPTSKADIVLLSNTEDAVRLLERHQKSGSGSDEGLSGMAMGWLDRDLDKIRGVVKSSASVNGSFKVIRHNARPDPADVVMFIGIMAVAIILLVLGFRRRRVLPLPPLPASQTDPRVGN